MRAHLAGSWAGSCVALLLALAAGVRAQDATWNGVTANFNSAANWSPNTVPTGTAFFGARGLPAITFSGPATLGGFTFNAGRRPSASARRARRRAWC